MPNSAQQHQMLLLGYKCMLHLLVGRIQVTDHLQRKCVHLNTAGCNLQDSDLSGQNLIFIHTVSQTYQII